MRTLTLMLLLAAAATACTEMPAPTPQAFVVPARPALVYAPDPTPQVVYPTPQVIYEERIVYVTPTPRPCPGSFMPRQRDVFGKLAPCPPSAAKMLCRSQRQAERARAKRRGELRDYERMIASLGNPCRGL